MLEPMPLLRPSPLEVSDVFAGTFAVLKSRFGTFALITLVPVLILLGAAAGTLFSMGAMLPELPGLAAGRQLSPGPLAGYLGSLAVAAIVQPLISLKATAMMMVGTYETVQGQTPTFGSLWRGTKGFLPRIFPLLLIFAVIMFVVYVALAFFVIGIARASGDSGQAALGAFALVILMAVVIGVPVAIYFGVKLIYVVPVIGVEKLSSFAGLKRAWSLTTGAFWRTFGYYLVATIVVQGVAMMVSSLVQAGMVPALGGMPQADTLAEFQAMFTVLLPAYLISMAAQSLVQIMTTPFQNAYLAIMYLDQRGRTEAPIDPTAAWTPPPPAWPPAQGPQG